jgi:hypothetical protein
MDEPTILFFETLFCMWEYFNMAAELHTKVILGQTLNYMQTTFKWYIKLLTFYDLMYIC